MVSAMQKEFAHLNLTFSIGGQISFDVFPSGWDKTYCLQFIDRSLFDEVHFFGDKTFEGAEIRGPRAAQIFTPEYGLRRIEGRRTYEDAAHYYW